MLGFGPLLEDYLDYNRNFKRLSVKTIKAYQVDIKQFIRYLQVQKEDINETSIKFYFMHLNENYRSTSVKWKFSAIKAFCKYLKQRSAITANPFAELHPEFAEEIRLPRIISQQALKRLLRRAHLNLNTDIDGKYRQSHFTSLRNVIVLELLFATGVRVAELCDICLQDIDLQNRRLTIFGKGSRQRIIYIASKQVSSLLASYLRLRYKLSSMTPHLFLNRMSRRLSEQSVRIIIAGMAREAGVQEHVTPHMFRHTLATSLLDNGVDCRQIQQILGHSSIVTTERYTHVSLAMQKAVLDKLHPRNKMNF